MTLLCVFRWKGYRNRDSAVGIITVLQAGQLGCCGWILNRGKGFFSFPKHPGHLWDAPSLLFSGYHRGHFFPKIKALGAQRSPLILIQCWSQEWMELYLHCPICLHGIHRDNCTFKDLSFAQHCYWRFRSSWLLHWVAEFLIREVSKEYTIFIFNN